MGVYQISILGSPLDGTGSSPSAAKEADDVGRVENSGEITCCTCCIRKEDEPLLMKVEEEEEATKPGQRGYSQRTECGGIRHTLL